ncbi:hypothetical protein BGZ51_003103 [Haplosporangium sp. Z 767]|nr:hypothetical protein BGZ51_003103 [Haplosporangium sp. Z 767]KAF9195724.1 hypothetical protein BGZ50_003671 [Haplosporangium sp. Z 11]
MATTFSSQDMADLKESFEIFDRNNDGAINRRELHALLHTVGHKLGANGLESLLSEYDADKSGTIDFDEFVKLAEILIKHKLKDN